MIIPSEIAGVAINTSSIGFTASNSYLLESGGRFPMGSDAITYADFAESRDDVLYSRKRDRMTPRIATPSCNALIFE